MPARTADRGCWCSWLQPGSGSRQLAGGIGRARGTSGRVNSAGTRASQAGAGAVTMNRGYTPPRPHNPIEVQSAARGRWVWQHPRMGSRRGGRRRQQQRDREISAVAPLKDDVNAGTRTNDAERAAETGLVVTSDPWFVQFADLTACTVDGCPAAAEPEAWEFVDLDTGNELPDRFCEEHQLAYLSRPVPAPAAQ